MKGNPVVTKVYLSSTRPSSHSVTLGEPGLVEHDSVFTDEDFHSLILWVILPTSVIAVAAARYRHPDRRVLMWVGSGMALLLLAALWAHDHAPRWVDISLTTTGGLILAVGHIRNLRLSRHH